MKKKRFVVSIFVLLLSVSLICAMLNIVVSETTEYQTNDQVNSSGEEIWDWSDILNVSMNSSTNSGISDIAVDVNGNVHIVWSENDDYIYYKKFLKATQTWGPKTLISLETPYSGRDSVSPSIAVDFLGNVHVVWQDEQAISGHDLFTKILYRQWVNLTSSWTTTELVSVESDDDAYNPSLAVDSSGDVHVVWSDKSNISLSDFDEDIFYAKRISTTNTWTDIELVSFLSFEESKLPCITIDNNDIAHIVWQEYLGNFMIFYTFWNTTLSSWAYSESLSSIGDAYLDYTYPSLVTDENCNIHVVWMENGQIKYNYKEFTLPSWENEETLFTGSMPSDPYYPHGCPSICSDFLGNIYISWTAEIGDSDEAVFFKTRNSFSFLWSSTEIKSSVDNSGHGRSSCLPSLSADSEGNIHLVWTHRFVNYLETAYMVGYHPPFTSPILACITPNPNPSGIVNLDWNSIWGTTAYYVYRETTFIWDPSKLTPIAEVIVSNYTDEILIDGTYFYLITAENYEDTNAYSNCECVEISIRQYPVLSSPKLAYITPNPTENNNIFLDWDDIANAEEYQVYRSSSYIWSVDGLAPIATVFISNHTDSLPEEGFYFYVVVAIKENGIVIKVIFSCWKHINDNFDSI